MKFQDIVYRCPGAHSLPGGSYDYRGVNSEDELEKALSDGWFNTMGEAIEGRPLSKAGTENKPVVSVVAPTADGGDNSGGTADDSTPPTREEMELKAKELKDKGLKISFNWRTSDEVLLERINEALAK